MGRSLKFSSGTRIYYDGDDDDNDDDYGDGDKMVTIKR